MGRSDPMIIVTLRLPEGNLRCRIQESRPRDMSRSDPMIIVTLRLPEGNLRCRIQESRPRRICGRLAFP